MTISIDFLPYVEWGALLCGAAVIVVPDRGDRRAMRSSIVLAAAIVIGTVPVLRGLRVADLNWCYPYMQSDSWDWINNGLYWAGADVASSFRPPGLPFVIAALWKLGALPALPAFNFLALVAATVCLYRWLRLLYAPPIAAICAWIFFSNGYVQDLTRWVMAEIWGTAFIVAAAYEFARASDDPRRYRRLGAVLGVGFLFSYTVGLAALGMAVVVVLARRSHLRLASSWQGAALAALPAIIWIVARRVHGSGHPVESLVRLFPANLRFYAFTGAALLGLALLPLYGAGALRIAARPERLRHPLWESSLASLVAIGSFWLFLYDWRDKRFLLYLFPFLVGFLAEGFEALAQFARRNRPALAVACGTVAVAVLWNQIQYPPYGIGYLALTPRDFLEAGHGIEGATVRRLRASWRSAFGGGLFDYRTGAPVACDLAGPMKVLALKPQVDALLPPAVPVCLLFHRSLPPEGYWAELNRLSNVLLRPVVGAERANLCLSEGREVVGRPVGGAGLRVGEILAGRGAYSLVTLTPATPQ